MRSLAVVGMDLRAGGSGCGTTCAPDAHAADRGSPVARQPWAAAMAGGADLLFKWRRTVRNMRTLPAVGRAAAQRAPYYVGGVDKLHVRLLQVPLEMVAQEGAGARRRAGDTGFAAAAGPTMRRPYPSSAGCYLMMPPRPAAAIPCGPFHPAPLGLLDWAPGGTHPISLRIGLPDASVAPPPFELSSRMSWPAPSATHTTAWPLVSSS